MGFSITSTVFSGLIITVYSVSLASLSDYHSGYRYSGEGVYDTKLALSAITLILGIAEFATGLCAVICCCLMKPCTCSVYCCMTLHKQVRLANPTLLPSIWHQPTPTGLRAH